ncbi:MAG: ribonuclease Z [Gemmatimonadales bacterium]|nr:MAG: ribonuclease Z [Gemmatimonadales bacterium]
MQATILGSGILLPDDAHHSAAHLVEAGGVSLLLDCGPGTLHGLDRFGKDWTAVSHLVLSHFHTDHVGDLAALFWARTHGLPGEGLEPFTLLGPVGTTHHLKSLARAHGEFILHPGGPLEIVELAGDGRWLDPEGRFELAYHPTPHTDQSIAVRVEAGGAAVGYTGDTGPSPELPPFFRHVELLIAECAVLDPTQLPNHLSPTSVAQLAMGAAPDLLVLTHLYPEVDREALPDLLRARGYTGRVRVAEDGDVFEVAPGSAAIPNGSPNE